MTMRPTKKFFLATLAALLFAALPALAQQPIAITNARIVTVSGPVIPRGTVVIRDGKIAAVGASVSIPSGARTINADGATLYPGLMDSYTTLGLSEIGQGANSTVDTTEFGTFNPTASAADSINQHSEVIGTVRVNGITHAVASPRGGFIGGQAALINLFGWTPQEMAVQPGVALQVTLPHWSRVTPAQIRGGGPGGGGGAAAPPSRQERERYAAQQMSVFKDFIARSRAYAAMRKSLPPGSPAAVTTLERQWETMMPFVSGERVWLIAATTTDQITDAIAFIKEMNIKGVINGGRDAWKVADKLAEAKVPVLIDPLDMPARESDPYDSGFTNAAALAKAGVKFAITSAAGDDSRNLPFITALAVAYGLSPEDAIRAITLSPAEIFGVSDRLGSIEVGKIANLVLAGGDILDVRTPIRNVIIAGQDIPLVSRHTILYDKFKVR